MYGDQCMEMIGHDDEIQEVELLFGNERAKDVDQQICISFRLENAAAHARFRCYEEGTRGIKDAVG